MLGYGISRAAGLVAQVLGANDSEVVIIRQIAGVAMLPVDPVGAVIAVGQAELDAAARNGNEDAAVLSLVVGAGTILASGLPGGQLPGTSPAPPV